jgi:hypothetical protein
LNHWPFPGSHLEEGYAYLLMHPGTPCVFYDHFWDQGPLGQAVRKLLKVRRTNGIHARSKVRTTVATCRPSATSIETAFCCHDGGAVAPTGLIFRKAAAMAGTDSRRARGFSCPLASDEQHPMVLPLSASRW